MGNALERFHALKLCRSLTLMVESSEWNEEYENKNVGDQFDMLKNRNVVFLSLLYSMLLQL